jgi:hypothetical protein
MMLRSSPSRLPIRKVSKRQARKQREWKAVTKQRKEMADGWCEARWSDCTGQGEYGHHVRARSQGGENTVENCRWICGNCHRAIHLFPQEAKDLGMTA